MTSILPLTPITYISPVLQRAFGRRWPRLCVVRATAGLTDLMAVSAVFRTTCDRPPDSSPQPAANPYVA